MNEKEGHARTHTRLRPFDVDKAQSIGNANPKHMLVASYFKTFSLLLVGGSGVTAAATAAVVVLFSLCFLSSGAHTPPSPTMLAVSAEAARQAC